MAMKKTNDLNRVTVFIPGKGLVEAQTSADLELETINQFKPKLKRKSRAKKIPTKKFIKENE